MKRLTLKFQYFGYLLQTADSLEKILMVGKTDVKRRREQYRIRWLNSITDSRHEFEQTLEDSGGQRSLSCCSPSGHKESDMTATEQQ